MKTKENKEENHMKIMTMVGNKKKKMNKNIFSRIELRIVNWIYVLCRIVS